MKRNSSVDFYSMLEETNYKCKKWSHNLYDWPNSRVELNLTLKLFMGLAQGLCKPLLLSVQLLLGYSDVQASDQL